MALLKPMEFKKFVWPHNPYEYRINYQKRIITHEYPEWHGGEIEDLGNSIRVFTGSGVFYGEGAYLKFQELATVYYEMTPGRLYHPKWDTIQANFTKLDVKQEPTPNYVEYTFEFMEYRDMNIIVKLDNKKKSGSTTTDKAKDDNKNKKKDSTYTVKKGDTLWDISKKYYGKGSDWKKIANANKKLIKDPNLILIGWKITIP